MLAELLIFRAGYKAQEVQDLLSLPEVQDEAAQQQLSAVLSSPGSQSQLREAVETQLRCLTGNTPPAVAEAVVTDESLNAAADDIIDTDLDTDAE